MNRLRAQVGSIDARANVEGHLVIDGRSRGKLPILAPVRVLPGKRVVRITKDGYETFEETIEVKVGETVTIDARLVPLASAGRLRIDEPEGAELYVDGALVGSVPWEGTLAPGTHLVFVRRGDEGSAPQSVMVVQGQTVLAAAKVATLGPELRLLVVPATAELSIGNVVVGTGRWQGRLPLGSHQVEAREEGYFPVTQSLRVDETTGGDVTIRLQVDEAHPRWASGLAGEVWFDVFGGPGFAPGLRSDAEKKCAAVECDADSTAIGFLAGARIGYEFPFGMSLEVAGGYTYLHLGLQREIDQRVGPVQARYAIEDSIRVSGPFAAAGVGFRRMLGEHLQLRSHLLVGVLFSSAQNDVGGTITAGGQTRQVALEGAQESVSGVDLLVMPELHLGGRWGGFSLSAGLTVGFLALEGPTYETGDLNVIAEGPCPGSEVDCARGSALLQGERAYGPFYLFVPSVSLGYAF
jgi:hypothetical protein